MQENTENKKGKWHQRFRIALLDALFPIHCLGCNSQTNGVWICNSCFSAIKLKKEQVCPYCEKRPTPAGRVCFSCRQVHQLDGLLVSTFYQNDLIVKAVHSFKYKFIDSLAEPLGEILVKSYTESNLPIPDLIVPIPLHPLRLRWRGYNQSELLGLALAEKLAPGYPILLEKKALIRKKFTLPQMSLKSYYRRHQNVQGAFAFNDREARLEQLIANKRILLVDDIATTGATLFECANILKKKGAKEVFGIVIARQEISK